MSKAPQGIKAHQAERTIEIRWSDDDVRLCSAHDLRCACPCAVCVDERTGERTLDPSTVPEDVTVQRMALVGRYAVTFVWSDGHSTGVYTWDHLRSLPRCVRQ